MVHTIRRREFALAMVVAAASGFVDAAGFIALGGYFVSFISGNSTTMAARAAYSDWQGAGRALGLIGLFFIGVITGSVLSRTRYKRSAVLWPAVGLVTVSAIASDLGVGTPAILLLAVAMGIVNSTFQRGGEVSVGLTYMTGTLVKAGQRLVDAFNGGPRWVWLRHLSLWASLTCGALVGGFAWAHLGSDALWIAAGMLAVAATTVSVSRWSPQSPG